MAMILRKGSIGEAVKRLQKALHLIPDGIFGAITEESVKAFQKANGLKPDGVVGEKTWEKINAQETGLKMSKRFINRIIVHCTATPEGSPRTVEQIRRDHIINNHWSDIGYHYVVYLDGSIHNGRNVDIVGAHCYGYNANSIGVVYVGGCDKRMKAKDTRTERQKESLLKLLKDLRRLYPKAKICGHRDLDKKGKECPSFDATKEYKNI